MRYTVICLKLLLILVVLGCKKRSQEQEKAVFYYANLYARYLQDEKHIKGTASFSKGSSLASSQSIQMEGGVSFFGHPMEEKKFGNDTRYIFEQTNADYSNQKMIFYFNGEKGEVEQYQFQMLPIRKVQLIGSASKSNGLKLSFSGGPIKSNQQLIVLFSDEQKKAHTLTLKGPITDTIELTADQIKDWTSGKGQLYLVKQENKEEKVDKWLIQTEIEFYSGVIDLELQ